MFLFEIVAVIFGLAMVGVCAGIRLAEIPEASRRIVPFSGGLLMGIALFWVLPEVAAEYGWITGLVGIVGGFTFLWIVDRFVSPVCPACSHSHDHQSCANTLHGFAAPLLTAASLHAFFDGWSIGVSQEVSSGRLKLAFLIGIGVHKLPEGVALGVLLLAATGSEWKAGFLSLAAQACMLVGALVAVLVTGHVAPHWTSALLAASAGIFVYLGYHAVEGQSRSTGLSRIMMPALTGAAGAAMLRLVPGL